MNYKIVKLKKSLDSEGALERRSRYILLAWVAAFVYFMGLGPEFFDSLANQESYIELKDWWENENKRKSFEFDLINCLRAASGAGIIFTFGWMVSITTYFEKASIFLYYYENNTRNLDSYKAKVNLKISSLVEHVFSTIVIVIGIPITVLPVILYSAAQFI